MPPPIRAADVGQAVAKGDLLAEFGLRRLVAGARIGAAAGGQDGCGQQRERK
jgi:hypothetical protein